MLFRIVAGGSISCLGTGIIIISLAGPLGTFVGRIVMSYIVGTPLKALVIASLPGMVYTMISSYFIYKVIEKIVKNTPYKNFIKSVKVG
jgi:uncharacterized membrane-anchored protein YitT (DUF2179 family)